jgi:4-amino-4-deoxy-L-arabinose transferase-like glycosyltransferase
MVQTLSMTTHAHVVSRLTLALALYAYVALCTGGAPQRHGALLGFAAGTSLCTRTPETLFIMLPVAAHLLWRAARERGAALRALLAAVPAFLVLAGLYAAFNTAMTGVWFLPPRFDEGATEYGALTPQPAHLRLGLHLGHNLMLLVVMALGPLGALLAVLGIRRDAPTMTLAAALGSLLSLSLLHDNVGIHTVGPIHLSDGVPIVIVLATVGTIRIFHILAELKLPRTPAAAMLVAYAAGGLTLFTMVHSAGLQAQAIPHDLIGRAVVAAGAQDAVVIGDPPAVLVRMRPEFVGAGSWVYQLPHPDPYLEKGPIYVKRPANEAALAALRARFPNRAVFHMRYFETAPFVRLERLP